MSEIINRLDFSLLRFLEAALHSPLPDCSCSSKHNIYSCVETTPKKHLLKWFMYDRAISHLEKKNIHICIPSCHFKLLTMPLTLILSPAFHVLTYRELPFGVGSFIGISETAPSFPMTKPLFLLWILMKCINDLLPESPGFSWCYLRLSSLLSGPSYWVFPWKTHPSHHPPYGTSVFQCLLCFSSSLPFCKKCPAKMASLGIVFFSCLKTILA